MGEASAAADYVVIHEFLRGTYESLTLGEAFRRGLIDDLLDRPLPIAEQDELLRFFFTVLEVNDVVEQRGDHFELSDRFRDALRFRDLMQEQIKYSSMLMRDLAMNTGAVFALGDDVVPYDHGRVLGGGHEYLRLYQFDLNDSDDPVDQAATSEWVEYMNILSRYESPVVCERYDFSPHRRMLDIGGNTGEFARAVCERNPDLRAVVFDLPGVVERGQKIQAGRPGIDQVEYLGGDAFAPDPPTGFDLVSFKSVLHDWPDEKAAALLETAWAALEPGGTLLVVERSKFDLRDYVPAPFSLLTLLGWAWTFRGPDRYRAVLDRLGAVDVQVEGFELDLPWMVLTAHKPAA